MAKSPRATTFSFDGKNPSAARAAERIAARFVTLVSDETRAAIRLVIVRSIKDGIPTADAARLIKSLIGLTSQQAAAVMSYRAGLVEYGVSSARVQTLVDRYTEKKLRERSITIAQTEIMDGLNTGVRESWKQARSQGFLGKKARKGIVVTPDERLCPVCGSLESVTVPLEEDFPTLYGPKPGPPFHQRCRCGQTLHP